MSEEIKIKDHPLTEEEFGSADVYDQSFIVDRKCPLCGNYLISQPDCSETCSNKYCDHELR